MAADAVAGVHYDISADTAKLEAGVAKAKTHLRGAAAAGDAAGKQIAAAFTRLTSIVAGALGVDQLTRFASEALKSAAAIGRFADQAGLTAQQFQGLEHAMRGAGLTTEQMAQGFAVFSRNLSDLQRGTGPLLDFLRRFAPHLIAQFKAAKDTASAFGVLTDAVNSLSDAQDRVRLLTVAGSEQFGRLANTMRQGRAAIDEQAAAFRGLSDDAIQNAQDIERRWETMWRKLRLDGQQAVLAIAGVLRDAPASTDPLQKQLDELETQFHALAQAGRDFSAVLARIDVTRIAIQVRDLGNAFLHADGVLQRFQATAGKVGNAGIGFSSDQVRAANAELARFMVNLQFIPPLSKAVSGAFASAWAVMRASMVANNATQAELEAARLNLMRQLDAQHLQLLGGTLNAEEMLARRREELHQARVNQLITEEQLQRALLAAQMAHVSGYLSSFGSIAGSMSQIFKKQKAWAYAAAVINTAAAVTAALAQPPYWPFNALQVAAAVAAGAAQIATISSTNVGSTSGGAGSAPTPVAAAAPAASSPTQALQINVQPGRYSHEEVMAIIAGINEAVGNGATIISTTMK